MLSKFITDYSLIESQQIIAHVRRTSCGNVSYMNTHPFSREWAGKDYVFAHNGTLHDFERLKLTAFFPIGKTDSEWAFCYILSAIRQREIPDNWEREDFNWLWQKCREINQLGHFNCLIADGQRLFCYHDQEGYNGLSFVERLSPFSTVRLIDEDYEIDLRGSKDPEQRGYIIASHPLTDENWQGFTDGELMVFNKGRLEYSSRWDETGLPKDLDDPAMQVLFFIRNAPRAIDIDTIVQETGLTNNEVEIRIKQLVNKDYLKQHCSDTVNWDHGKARFFTRQDRRPEIDRLKEIYQNSCF